MAGQKPFNHQYGPHMHVTDGIYLTGNEQKQLAVSTTGAQTPVLDEGKYLVWMSVDVFIKVAAPGLVATDVTVDNGCLIKGGNHEVIIIGQGEKLGAILSTGTGTFRYHRIG